MRKQGRTRYQASVQAKAPVAAVITRCERPGRLAGGRVFRLVVLAVALAGMVAPDGRGIGKPAFVAFNTVCSQCHEAECSGRLTFHGGAAAAREHVLRYTGPIPEAEVEELAELLRHTKQECSVFPMPEDVPPGEVWPAAALRSFYDLRRHAYYVPLGAPAQGRCRLRIELDADAEVAASLMTSQFELVHEHAARSRDRRIETDWPCHGAERYYLRLSIDGDAQLRELVVDDMRAAE